MGVLTMALAPRRFGYLVVLAIVVVMVVALGASASELGEDIGDSGARSEQNATSDSGAPVAGDIGTIEAESRQANSFADPAPPRAADISEAVGDG